MPSAVASLIAQAAVLLHLTMASERGGGGGEAGAFTGHLLLALLPGVAAQGRPGVVRAGAARAEEEGPVIHCQRAAFLHPNGAPAKGLRRQAKRKHHPSAQGKKTLALPSEWPKFLAEIVPSKALFPCDRVTSTPPPRDLPSLLARRCSAICP